MNYSLTLLTGLAISFVIFLNGSLQQHVGILLSLIFIHLSGLLCSLLLFLKREKKAVLEKKSPFYLLAGTIGIVIVIISNYIFSRGGVFLTLSGTLSGQVIWALALEIFRLKKDRSSFPFNKLLSALVVLLGAIYIGSKNGFSFSLISLSWIPGILILIQTHMNSQNTLSMGFKKMLLVHFGSPFILLTLFYFIFIYRGGDIVPMSNNFPKLLLIGGGSIAVIVVSLSSILFLKIKPITFVLLLNIGQIIGAICLDTIMGLDLSIDKIVTGVVIVLGVLIGGINFSFFKRFNIGIDIG